MSNEKQQQMEQRIRSFVENVSAGQQGRVLGMIRPSFVSCDAEEQTLLLSYPCQDWESNPNGVMQGGIVATILDFSIACLAINYAGDAPVTVSLQTSYLRGCPVSGTLMVKVRATKVGRTLLHAFVECWEESTPGKLVATANGAYMAG